MSASLPPPPRRLTGGVVAFNEERRVRAALRSLLDQELPGGYSWDAIWVVASGCTDATVDEVEAVARADPRVRIVVQPERGGKSAALRQIFARATGRYLVLLNGDAVAEPGAVRHLVADAEGLGGAFGIMARPVPPEGPGLFAGTVELLWSVHHRFHEFALGGGAGTHLSDEMMILPVDRLPELPDGVVNDGAYIGAWLARHGGLRRYVPAARVGIAVPRAPRELLLQRRRILYGNRQVRELLATDPSTILGGGVRRPGPTLRLVVQEVFPTRSRWPAFALLVGIEALAHLLAAWDRGRPRVDHVRWQRIVERPMPGRAFDPAAQPAR